MERAVGMLQSGHYTNERIAGYIGFANVTAFYNAFKKYFGVTPAQVKKGTLAFGATSAVLKHAFNLAYSIREMHEKPLVFLSHIGDYKLTNTSAFETTTWTLCMNMPITIICCRKGKSIGEFVTMTLVSPSLINVVFMLV